MSSSVPIKKEESTIGVPFPPHGNINVSHNNQHNQSNERITDDQHSEDVRVKKEATEDSESQLLSPSVSQPIPSGESQQQQQQGQVIPENTNLKIINRQITGYVGFANLPKQWHRKSIRKGFNLNVLTVGKSGLGKTTLINSLFNENFSTDSDSMKSVEQEGENEVESSNEQTGNDETTPITVKIDEKTKIIEENGVKLKLTVVDTPGFGDAIDNTESWKPIVNEINYRFDQYLDSENKINRSSMSENDKRIHVCLYFIEPTGHFLKPLDIEFCSMIHEKCNLIPVIAKSDILTDEEINKFKLRIKKQLEDAGITLFKPPIYRLDDSETAKISERLYESLPYAVVGSNNFVKDPSNPTEFIRAREYPWGIIEVENSNHSDFTLLRDLLVKQYLEELRERTNNELYENYRSQKLISLGIKQDNSVFREYDPTTRQDEEKKLHEAKLAKLEAEMKSVFQQKVSEKEKKLQKSETELFARHKEMKDKLTKQLKALEEKKHQLEVSNSNVQASPAQPKKKGFLR